MCTLNEPEDEIHFLCLCRPTLYISLRKPLFDEAIKFSVDFQSFSNTNKFIWIINNNWRDVINVLLAELQVYFFL